MFLSFYKSMLSDFNISEKVIKEIAYNRTYALEKYTLYPNIKNELERLKEKYQLILLTDNWPCVINYLKKYDLFDFFEKIYVSSFYGVEKKDGSIIGRMVKTYATTQKYRQSKRQSRSIIINGYRNGKEFKVDGQSFSFGNGFPFDDSLVFDTDSVFFSREKSSESWLSEFNTYKKLFLKNPDGTAASHYATYLYKLCKNAKSLEDAEKKIVETEIRKLKNKTKDEFIQQLFDMSVVRLKK